MESLKDELAKWGRDKVKPLRYQRNQNLIRYQDHNASQTDWGDDIDSINPVTDIYESSVHLKKTPRSHEWKKSRGKITQYEQLSLQAKILR